MNLSANSRNFFLDVYEVVKLIPEGKVTSYGSIAKYLGAVRSSRMVGWAMNAAHGKPEVPAHRVVNRAGLLTGKEHFEDPFAMQRKLEAEGIAVIDNQIVNFASHFWDPMQELTIE